MADLGEPVRGYHIHEDDLATRMYPSPVRSSRVPISPLGYPEHVIDPLQRATLLHHIDTFNYLSRISRVLKLQNFIFIIELFFRGDSMCCLYDPLETSWA
jgi:hypothetical protein